MGIYLGANELGGGGEGSGINSYAPFKVGTADNNPQGYIHSTGVYTNPVDESVWLKTGRQIDYVAADYPNAMRTYANFKAPTVLFDYTVSTDFLTQVASCQAINGTDFVFFGRKVYPSHEIQVVTPLGVATGPSGVTTAPPGIPRGLVTDGTDYFMITAGDSGATCYVFSGTTMQQTSTFSVGFNADGIAFNSLKGNLVFTDAGNKRELTTSGDLVVATSFTASVSKSWTYDSIGDRYLFLDGSYLRWITNSYTFGGNSFSYAPGYSLSLGHLYDGTFYASTNQDTNFYQSLPDVSIGDPTARTSAMGDGQPLFIKLK